MKTNKGINIFFQKILFVFFIISTIYALYTLLTEKKEQKETQNLLNTIVVDTKETENKRIAQVKQLKEQYPNVVGWIEIEGTNISYPVMQGEDNDYYMNHNYKGEKVKTGSIFLDKDYDWSIPSSNLLMYGHNKKSDTTMFSDLLKYKDEDFYKKYSTIRFTTPEEDSEYEIISAFLSRVYYKNELDVFRYYYFINAENQDEFNNFVSNAKRASLYDTGKTAQYGEQLITLSTCEYSQKDGRFAVVARKK